MLLTQQHAFAAHFDHIGARGIEVKHAGRSHDARLSPDVNGDSRIVVDQITPPAWALRSATEYRCAHRPMRRTPTHAEQGRQEPFIMIYLRAQTRHNVLCTRIQKKNDKSPDVEHPTFGRAGSIKNANAFKMDSPWHLQTHLRAICRLSRKEKQRLTTKARIIRCRRLHFIRCQSTPSHGTRRHRTYATKRSESDKISVKTYRYVSSLAHRSHLFI